MKGSREIHMRNLTEANLTDAVIASISSAQDERFREVMISLVRHLHGFLRDTHLTEAEWQTAIQVLTAIGQKCDEQRQEFVLLSDVLGVTTLKDILNHRKVPGATEHTILGPFYRLDAPEFHLGESIAADVPGEPVVIRGRVLARDGTPIPDALLDVWQSDGEGSYDLQMPLLQETALRGRLHTDSEGRYIFRTIKPCSYPIPGDGPVGSLLRKMGRHPYRPAHVHFIVSAEGYEAVTTELFVDEDPYLDSDPVFGVRESLVVPFVQHNSEEEAARLGVSVPFFTVDYDFVLESLQKSEEV